MGSLLCWHWNMALTGFFFHLQCLNLQFSDELRVILGEFRTTSQRLEGVPSPECLCWASTSLPGEGSWISHCFDFLRSFPGEKSQRTLAPGPGMSKMSLVGDTGGSTRQSGSCCLLCLMFGDRGEWSKVPAQPVCPAWAERKRLEMCLHPANVSVWRREIRRRDLARLCFGEGEEKSRKAKPCFRAGVCEPLLVLLQEWGHPPLCSCGKEMALWHLLGWMLCRLWREIGSSLAEDTAFIPYVQKIRIQLYKNVFQDS